MESIQSRIENFITRKRGGGIFLPVDFLEFGGRDAIDKALSRLVKKGIIKRIAQGLYVRPKYSELLKTELIPSVEEIVAVIAKREKRIVQPSGAMAANILGLSFQVPARLVYLTSGTAKKLTVGKSQIEFRPATPKSLVGAGTTAGLVIQALKYLGEDEINKQVVEKLSRTLRIDDKKALKSLIRFIPAWMVPAIKQITQNRESKDG